MVITFKMSPVLPYVLTSRTRFKFEQNNLKNILFRSYFIRSGVSPHRGFAWILAKRMPADDETLTYAATGATDNNPTDTF